MLKFILWMFFPLLPMVRYIGEDGAGGGGSGGGDGGGDGGGSGDGGSRSMEIPPDGGRTKTPAGGGDKPWFESAGVDPAILTDKDKEYKTLGDYVKGAQSARQLAASKGIPLPAKDATPEQKAAFQAEVMKHFPDLPVAPESADKYEIPMFKDSGLPETRQKAITGAFHKAGLSNKHAQAVMDIYADQVAQDMEDAQAQIATQRTATDAELKTEWGAVFADRQAGIDRIGEKYPELFAVMKSVGIDARKDFRVMMDEVARSISEDHPGGSGKESADGIETQITELRTKIKGTENSLERQKLIKQESELYKKRDALRKK
jgi:hypothetical protein